MNASQQLDQVIALAGLFQACALVRRVAREGEPDPGDLATCVQSLFRFDAETVESVFGGRERLRNGLATLTRQLSGRSSPADAEVRRYAASLMYLERRLVRRRPDLLEGIRAGLEAIQGQEAAVDAHETGVIDRIAELYQHTVSTLSPQIRVFGEPKRLQVARNAALIRALLLAGMRSAVLWRQVGGNRWRLLLGRRRLAALAEGLGAELGL